MWHCDGQCQYEAFGQLTQWHGKFEHLNKRTIRMKFNALGREEKLHSTVVEKIDDNTWEGYDYKSHKVLLRLCSVYKWNNTTKQWHRTGRLGRRSEPPQLYT